MKLIAIKILPLVVACCFASYSIAQNGSSSDNFDETVIVRKDPRFDELAAKQAEMNKRSLQIIPQRKRGWRIQAANTQNRDEANAVKADLLRRFPDQKTYLVYYSPNYRVKIGNFLTQREAMPLRKMIAKLFPGKGVYIVQDTIEYTLPPDEDEIILDKD